MKSFVKKMMVLPMFALGLGVLAGCNGGGSKTSEDPDAPILAFVPVSANGTSTSADVEQTFGNYTFKLKVSLKDGGVALFEATCTGKKASGGGGGGPGGPGGPGGGGFPPAVDVSADDSETSEEDLTTHNVSITGTWVAEAQIAYKLTFGQEEIHVDYLQRALRYQFNWSVTLEENTTKIRFEAEPDDFVTVPAGYKTYDEREASHVLLNADGSIHLCLMPQGKIIKSTYKGVSRDQDFPADTWSEANEVLTIGNATSESSLQGQPKAWRIVYSSTTFYCSLAQGTDTSAITDAMFDGNTILALNGSYESGRGPNKFTAIVSLELTDVNKALYKDNGTIKYTGTYTKEGQVYTVTLTGVADPIVLEPNEQGVYTATIDNRALTSAQ